MSRGNWNRIKQSKYFYVNTYRRLLKVIIFSIAINIALCVGIILIYLNKPKIDFYASNGIVPPIRLAALDQPNDSAEALLPPDPESDEDIKFIPE